MTTVNDFAIRPGDAALIEVRRFRGNEIAKIFTVPASQVEHLEVRRFPGTEAVRPVSVPGGELDQCSSRRSGQDSPDPEIVMDGSKKKDEKE